VEQVVQETEGTEKDSNKGVNPSKAMNPEGAKLKLS
jgi:hypothetical protein